jgi:hypothetical protein
MFPASSGANILQSSNSDETEIELLAVENPDGSVVIMLSNHALNAPSDNNGPGAPRTIAIDTSAFGTFQSGTLLTIDANTSVTSGPSGTPVTPGSQMTVTLDGYGVAFLTLK